MKTKLFPTLIVDEFLDNPDELVDLAKSLDYYYDKDYRWPGKRTAPLYEIDNQLFIFIGNKIISSYGFKKFKYKAIANFQIVNKNYSKGWIHHDLPMLLTSIIYLNKKVNINSGTSLYKDDEDPCKGVQFYPNITECKYNFFKNVAENDNYTMTEKEIATLEYQHGLFEETLNIKNVYNRMFTFESEIWHSANEYDSTLIEPRLTLVYFFEKLEYE